MKTILSPLAFALSAAITTPSFAQAPEPWDPKDFTRTAPYKPEVLSATIKLDRSAPVVAFDDLRLTHFSSTAGLQTFCILDVFSQRNNRSLFNSKAFITERPVVRPGIVTSFDIGFSRYALSAKHIEPSFWGGGACTIDLERTSLENLSPVTVEDAKSRPRIFSTRPFIEQMVIEAKAGDKVSTFDNGPILSVMSIKPHSGINNIIVCNVSADTFFNKAPPIKNIPFFALDPIGHTGYEYGDFRYTVKLLEASNGTCTFRAERRNLKTNPNPQSDDTVGDPNVLLRLTNEYKRVVIEGPTKIDVQPGTQEYVEVQITDSYGVAFESSQSVGLSGGFNVWVFSAGIEASLGQSVEAKREQQLSKTRGINFDGSVCREWEYTMIAHRRNAFVQAPAYGLYDEIPFSFITRTSVEARPLCKTAEAPAPTSQ